MTPVEFGIKIAAAKALGYYVDQGRGLLMRRTSAETPFEAWLGEAVGYAQFNENKYVPLSRLKETHAPPDTIELVEQYNPDTEAVVYIEFDDRDPFGPAVVPV